MRAIEIDLSEFIRNYNSEGIKRFKEIDSIHPDYKLEKSDFTIDLKRYKRQYIAVINSKGEKEVFINCFSYTGNKNWKTKLTMAIDGGRNYFNLKINLRTDKCYDFEVNGEG